MTATFEHVVTVNDDSLREALSYVGMELRYWSWNHEASRDSIRHYAHGLGDDNPLWCDPTYARDTVHGDIIAPPTFLYTVADTTCSPGLTGLQQIYGGSEWTFYRPVRRNEALNYRARVVGAREVTGKHGGRMILQTGVVDYFGAGGDQVASVKASTWRTARRGVDGGLAYEPRPRHETTQQELEAIEAAVRAEEVRGADPRYWEDVNVGDQLVPLVKGPLEQITMTCFYAGQIGSPGYKASELRWKNWILAKEDAGQLPNYVDLSYYSEHILPSLGHQDDGVARDLGMPGAYDNGPQRIGWLSHLVTNWMSDRGRLRNLNARVLRPNVFGDTTWVTGEVTGKNIDDLGLHPTVEIAITARNQLNETTAAGTATVLLPTRALRDPDL